MLSSMSQKSDQRVWAILCNRPDFESLNVLNIINLIKEWEL